MYAVTVDSPGGPEVLAWREVDDPIPAPHEVLMDVIASAVNRADLLQRAGHYAPPPGASPYLGLECSGRIAAVGSDVSRWHPGDEVCALLPGGGYAQRVAIRADHCLPIPDGVSLIDAAGLPEAACTVWSNVFDRAGLQPLDTLVIHGGASGIGTLAIQLGSAHGARVFTTASLAKHERLRELGAELTIDYATGDFAPAVHAATGGRGADVVLDIIGGRYLAQNVDCLAIGGRLVVIGLQGGRRGQLDLDVLLAKRATIIATTLRGRPPPEKAAIVAAVGEHVWPRIRDGLVRPVIHARLPMAEASEAHRMVEASEHIGKVLLTTPSI